MTQKKSSLQKKPVSPRKRKPRALITGITGQDGSYLAEHLLEKGYDVYGMVRRTSSGVSDTLEEMHMTKRATLIDGNLRDSATIRNAIETAKPDEIYNLAAQSHVGISFKCPEETWEVNYYGLGRLVHAAMKYDPAVRIYQASTSEMFGATPPPQTEKTAFKPVSPYAEAKLRGHEDFIKGYREKHNLFAASGILFNHESPRRGKQFVTRKVTLALARIQLGLQDRLTLGNMDAKRDWGFAGDYVRAMHLMLQAKKPDDYVVATGESHSVREFVEAAAKALDMHISWRGKGLSEVGVDARGKVIVDISKEWYRPAEVNYLLGDASKARRVLKWRPTVSFEKLVEMMVKADYDACKRASL